ncbi:MAG: polyprenyl synthetase family protein [Proteobacteria bacterium]|nr:polyprenyl synthetase family protein [Pseudomonadota bacterium]
MNFSQSVLRRSALYQNDSFLPSDRHLSRPSDQLAELVRRSRRDRIFRSKLASRPVAAAAVAGIMLDHGETAALREIGQTVFACKDDELEVLARRRRRWKMDRQQETAAQRLFAHRASITEKTSRILRRLDIPERLCRLLRRSLDEGAVWAEMAPCLPAIDFPAAIAACVGADIEQATPVSVAGLLYYLGISMVDDVIDREVEINWGDTPGEQVTMAGICLFSGLPMQAIRMLCDKRVKSCRLLDCYDIFERACYQMAVGQYLDIGSDFAESTTIDDCRRIIELKTGSTGELVATLSASMAGSTPETADSMARSCKYLYMSMQMASDIHDIWSKPISPDLANGIVTLPTLYAFHASRDGLRAPFRDQLQSHDWTESGHAEMRRHITSTGALCYSVLQAEATRQRAISAWSECAVESLGAHLFDYMFEAAKLMD